MAQDFTILNHIAAVYAAVDHEEVTFKRALVGWALQYENIEEFIDIYSQGWLGDCGKFARICARAIQAIQ